MKAFLLLALGSVYCTSTANTVTLKYLHSLRDVSKINEFDWVGHILEVVMEEVKKYKRLSPEHDHYVRSCLAILAVFRLSSLHCLLSMYCTIFKSLYCFVLSSTFLCYMAQCRGDKWRS